MHANVLPIPAARGTGRSRTGRRAISALMLSGLLACHRASGPAAAAVAGGAAGGVAAVATGGAAAGACGATAARSPVVSRAGEPSGDGAAIFDSAWTLIARTHWDTTYHGVDWVQVRRELRPEAAQARTRGELRSVLGRMVGRLGQSHFAIIPAEVADGAVAPTADDRAGGSLGLELRLLGRNVVVLSVDTGGPAWRAGVRPGWLLTAVGDCAVADRLAALPQQRKGRRAGPAPLDVYRAMHSDLAGLVGDTLALTFRDARDRVQRLAIVEGLPPGTITRFGNLPPVAAQLAWQRLVQDGRTVGVIRFSVWMPVLSAQFDAAMDSLRSSDAIVLDLRGNLGGVGGMATGIAGHFLDTALALGTMHQRGSTTRFLANPRRVDTRNQRVTPFAGPLAIVVDELSASTTEIFAGGLRTLGRATVFGTPSAGMALPAAPERLPNGDILYHAIADFTAPDGGPVEGVGVRPDHVTPLDRRSLLTGRDPALQAAVAWAARRPEPAPTGIARPRGAVYPMP